MRFADSWSLPGRVRPPSRTTLHFPGRAVLGPLFLSVVRTAGRSRRRKTRPERRQDDLQPPKREAEAGSQAARAQAPRARGAVRHRGRGPARGGPGGRRRAALRAGRRRQRHRGEEVEPELLAAVSALGSGTRAIAVWEQAWADRGRRRPASTCTGSATPATSARSSAPPTRCSAARSCSAPIAPTPSRRRRCGRAWARSSPCRRRGPAVGGDAARRGSRSSPTAATGSTALAGGGDALPRRRARGPAGGGRSRTARCEVTIPLRAAAAESLNVAAAAAIACERYRRRMREAGRMLERIEEIRARPRRRSAPPPARPSWRSCGSATSGAKPS